MAKPTGTQKPKRRRITFLLEATDASEVSLVGEFNDWNPKKHPMKKNADGQWVKQLLLGPGEFEYKFWIDGDWVVDPNNRRTRFNSFGTFNSIITIAPEKGRRS